jgi:O-acetyl-ADP-ribose deacetylase (regulator of RNase III)
MPISLLFFDNKPEFTEAYEKHITFASENFECFFTTGDVRKVCEDLAVTIIVSPANSLGFMDGGIDMFYMGMFPGIQNTVQDTIKTFNITTALGRYVLPIGSSILVKTGSEQVPYLLSAPTMFLPEKLNSADNVYWAFLGILQILRHYTKVEKLVVGIPSLGTGVGQLSAEDSAKAVNRALLDFHSKSDDQIYTLIDLKSGNPKSIDIKCNTPVAFVINSIIESN